MNPLVRQLEERAQRRLERKIPSWARIEGLAPPSGLALEQCSSEETALFKATLAQGDRLVDLTGGYGVDCAFMSRSFRQTDYVERDAALAETARRNFALLGLGIQVHNADAEDFLKTLPVVDCLFVDPARRGTDGRKVVSLPDCTPDVERLHDNLLARCRVLLLKLSAAHDISEALRVFPETTDVYAVGARGECKELLLRVRSGSEPPAEPLIHCVEGREIFRFRPSEEREAVPACAAPLAYVYEPDATLLKAGAFKCLCGRYGVYKLHPNSHLYTSGHPVTDFPGRTFAVKACLKANDKALKSIGRANLTVRNFPASVDALRKKWKLSEGGDTYLLATTLPDGSHRVLLCKKENSGQPDRV